MKTISYNFNVPADTDAEAEAKMHSLKILASKLSASELKKIADVIGNPIKLLIAKQKLGL